MYGYRLWLYKGARNKWALEALRKMQRQAACWITGAFQTSPGGGVEAIAGLPPVFLHMRKLATKAVCRIKTLSDTHPIRSLLKGPERKMAVLHALSLLKLGNPGRMDQMQSAVTEVQLIVGGLTEVFEPCTDEACPGARVIDLYPKQIEFLDWKIEDSL